VADWHSYKELLIKYLIYKDPKHILEWGPGESTRIMFECCPEAQIHSFESGYRWFEEASRKWKVVENVYIYYFKDLEQYITSPTQLGLMFDFVFVDGRQRVRCMNVAYDIMNVNAIIMLHDSERQAYNQGRSKYNLLEEEKGTAVLEKT